MKHKNLILAIAFLLILLATASYAQPIEPATIIPKPKNIQMLSATAVSIDSSWKIAADLATEDSFAASYLNEKISATLGANLGIVDITAMPTENPPPRIVIGNPNTNPAIALIASRAGISINNELIQDKLNQGYILQIQPNQILILANSTAGTFYGVISLMWLLKKEGSSIILPNTKIADWPDLKIRGFYGSSISYFSSREGWVEYLTKFKYNLWTSGPLSEFTRQRHFFLATILAPLALRYYDKNIYEGVWDYNIPLKFNGSGYAEPIKDDMDDIGLNNSDLEIDNDGDGVPDYWKIDYMTLPVHWKRDCDQSHSGKCSVKMTLSETITFGSSASFLTKNSYAIEPNKTYLFTFWAKKNDPNNSDRHPQVTVVMQDKTGKDLVIGGNRVYQNRDVDDSSGEWKQYNLMFSIYNNDVKFFRIYSTVMDSGPVELWLDDFQLIDATKELRNVIKTPSTELAVWNKQRTVKYKEGEDYRLNETGEFNLYNPLEGKKTIITRIETGRIAPEAEIMVDYDFVVRFQRDRDEQVTLSDPLVFDYYENQSGWLKDTMSGTYKPEYVLIQMDEITGFNRDSRGKKKGLENYQLLAEFLNKIIDMIHSYNPDTKVLIWDDMINPFHNGGQEDWQVLYGGQLGKTWYALDLLKRENVILVAWWYDSDYWQKMANSPALYNKLGFQFIVGPWDNQQNIKWWSYLANKYNAIGMLDHEFYSRVGGVEIAAEYAWNTIKETSLTCNDPNYPKTDYPEICDGKDNDCDARYYWNNSWTEGTWTTNIDEPFDFQNDPFNCGLDWRGCGNICYYPKAFSSCQSGNCSFDGCFAGYQNRDGNPSNGCEYYTACGNGGIDLGSSEECDGTTLNGETCVSLGYFGGTLACTSSCRFDTSNCPKTAVCGNGIIQGNERCDSSNVPTTCAAFGFAGGTLGCTVQCTLDTSGCTQMQECVDNEKLVGYYTPQWKRGEITMLTLMQKMRQWKAGTGC